MSLRLLPLFACAFVLACAGCSGERPGRAEAIARYSTELRDTVSARVVDQPRREQMLQVVDRIEALHVRFSRETADFIAAFRRLNADYSAARPAFDQLFADYGSRRVTARSEALELHYQLASLATEGEWASVGKAEARLYERANESRSGEEAAK